MELEKAACIPINVKHSFTRHTKKSAQVTIYLSVYLGSSSAIMRKYGWVVLKDAQHFDTYLLCLISVRWHSKLS